MWKDMNIHYVASDSWRHEVLETFYEYGKKYEFYPLESLRQRYKDYQLPLEFQEAFELFVEEKVMKMLSHYFAEYGNNREDLRAKYILYIMELIGNVKSWLDQGIPLWDYVPPQSTEAIEKKSELLGVQQFLTWFRESVITAINIATQPITTERKPDILVRRQVYIELLKRVGVKYREILP
jgi:hypothetical protein